MILRYSCAFFVFTGFNIIYEISLVSRLNHFSAAVVIWRSYTLLLVFFGTASFNN